MSDYKIRVDVGSDYSLAVESAKINGNLDDLKLKVSSVKKENGKNIITFSDGSQAIINDGATPTINDDGYWIINGQSTGVKGRAEHNFNDLTDEQKLSIKGDKGDPLTWPDLTPSQREALRGERGFTGPGAKVTNTSYDSSGNTVITFNDGTKATIKKGVKGDKGNTGDSVSVSSITKSGLTNTVRFTDGKSLLVQDGKSVTVSSSRFLTSGDTEVTFSDGNKAVIKKGVDGTVSFDKLTEEQRQSLVVPVVNDLTTGGVDKALSAEQGKVLFQNVDSGKNLIAKAIIDKDGNASKDDSFSDLAIKIKAIKTGYGVGDFIQPGNLKTMVEGDLSPVLDWKFTGHTGAVRTLAIDSQGNVYSSGADRKIIKISSSGQKIWEFTGKATKIFVDSMGYIYYTGDFPDIYVFKYDDNRNLLWQYTDIESNYTKGIVESNKRDLYFADGNKVIKISSSGQKIWEFTGHTGIVQALAADSQGNVYSGGYDNKVIKISSSGQKIWEFTGHTGAVQALAVDGQDNIYSGGSDNKVFKIKQEGEEKIVGYEVIK